MNFDEFSEPNAFASSTASLMATFGGTLSLQNFSSYKPIRSTLRSIAAILEIGHSGANGVRSLSRLSVSFTTPLDKA